MLKVKIISKEELLTVAKELKTKGYRLVSITCTQIENYFELIYSFDLNLTLLNFKIIVNDNTMPSLTSIYTASFLQENEIQDQFGISFENLNLNYQGKLFYPEKKPLFLNKPDMESKHE